MTHRPSGFGTAKIGITTISEMGWINENEKEVKKKSQTRRWPAHCPSYGRSNSNGVMSIDHGNRTRFSATANWRWKRKEKERVALSALLSRRGRLARSLHGCRSSTALLLAIYFSVCVCLVTFFWRLYSTRFTWPLSTHSAGFGRLVFFIEFDSIRILKKHSFQ